MVFRRKIMNLLVVGSSILFCFQVFSSLRLEQGSYANPTMIDTLTASANLNFTYYGCDPNPKAENIKLTTDGQCHLVRNYSLGQSGGLQSLSGTIGEMLVQYKGDQTNCSKKYTRTLHTRISLKDAYEKFQSKNCYPTHLLIRDSKEQKKTRFVWRTRRQRGLCALPETRISKQGFPTEEHPFFHLSANEDGFKIGDHTHYRYNHNRQQWCVSYRKNPYKCGQFPSPLPMAYKDKNTGKIHLKGVVALNPNGKASIFAIDKTYSDLKELFEDQKNGGFREIDQGKGRIGFRTWQKANGVPRSIVSSYVYNPSKVMGSHQRSIYFFPRNSFGVDITKTWCPEEHCFHELDVKKLTSLKCTHLRDPEKNTACAEDVRKNNLTCPKKPHVKLEHGGSRNICHSCLGMTPGLCAISKQQVQQIQQKLRQTDTFQITQQGEYKMRPGVEDGLAMNYMRMVETPKNKGCFVGYTASPEAGQGLRSAQSIETPKIETQKKVQEYKKTESKPKPESGK